MPKFIFLLLLFPLFGIVRGLAVWENPDEKPLYTANEIGIIRTNVTDYQSNLYNKDKVTVFQFYNSWCGHCQRFAPIFKEFGKLISNWNPMVQILVLDCILEENEEVCRNYSVISYPTVRLFWTNVNDQEDHGEHIENLQHNAEFLKERVLEFTMRNLKNTTKHVPASWPNLNKIKVATRPELQQVVAASRLNSPTDSVPLVAIAEKNDSFVGQQIILELSSYKDKIEILSLDIPSTNEINFTVDTSAKTALLQFDANTTSTYRILANLPLSEKNQTAYYVNYINQNLFDNKLVLYNQTNPDNDQDQNNTSTTQRTNVQPEDVPLSIGDLYGAVNYTLYRQIPLKKTLDGSQLNILKRFVEIVERYFPAGDDAKFIEFIHGLNEFLKSKEQELDIQDYLNYLKKNEFDFKSKFSGWTTCRGSKERYRGYTCSLWSLFHTLTLGEYTKERDAQKWVNLHEVLYTMRDYIGTFFSCTNCAQHFTSMAKDLENELKYPNSSVLWLWSRHNRVNQRLKGDITEDPEHPKAAYPYQKDCPQCYSPSGEFVESEVMRYLIARYAQVKRVELGHSTSEEPKHLDEQPQSDKLTFQSDPDTFKDNRVFSFADYSLIFALYALIATIVISVFFYLPIRIKRKAKARQTGKYLDA